MPIRREERRLEKSGGRRTRSFNNRNLRSIDRDGGRRDSSPPNTMSWAKISTNVMPIRTAEIMSVRVYRDA
jgi:hypothetical protein